ncbi:uncharacterized protein FA14DRAFT_181045 [Meira miltonrushii]|uniref:Uncharacterized protein n=1 Tax=Meira miltonrushii TaxID=1280837 RepID=A0A316VDS3_9BASI|nr:uncharacterized protein FA14DRAFT_181045 [Meira miltonrushii]PWN34423.1 hypothetical protein FA14DRAFT_181045 [Meira miltonrushii]
MQAFGMQKAPIAYDSGIRIREPVDRPPELLRTHPIQYNEPPPRYQDERPSTWQRLRGNRGSQVDSSKDKGKEKVEESPSPNSKKRKQPSSFDHEAGSSRTKIPEAKKQKGFWTRVAEHRYNRSYYQRQRDERNAEALLTIGGLGVYGAYHGAKAIAKGVKEGCDAACRAARNQANRLRNRITGTPAENPVTRNTVRNGPSLSNRDKFKTRNLRYRQNFHGMEAGPIHRNSQQPAQNLAAHQANAPAAHVQPQQVHQPQRSVSTHSFSGSGPAISDESSVDKRKGHHRDTGQQRHSSSSHSTHTSSASSDSVSRSDSISSRRRSPSHASGATPYSNQQTPVNQAIRIREPTDRPPELPQSHPVQHHEPPPRYENERPSMWERLRGNRGSSTDKGKGKMSEKEEEQKWFELGKKKRTEAAANDHEAGTSGTKSLGEKKKKGFLRRVYEYDRRHRYRYRTEAERERHTKAGEVVLGIVGAGVYGAYKGAEAVYNAGAAVGNKPDIGNSGYRQLHHLSSSGSESSQRLSRSNTGFNNEHPSPQHELHRAAAQAPIHARQHSLSTHSASTWGAAVTDGSSINRYSGHDRGIIEHRHPQSSSQTARFSSNSTPSTRRGSVSQSPSMSSPRSRSHASGSHMSRGSDSSRHHRPNQ